MLAVPSRLAMPPNSPHSLSRCPPRTFLTVETTLKPPNPQSEPVQKQPGAVPQLCPGLERDRFHSLHTGPGGGSRPPLLLATDPKASGGHLRRPGGQLCSHSCHHKVWTVRWLETLRAATRLPRPTRGKRIPSRRLLHKLLCRDEAGLQNWDETF